MLLATGVAPWDWQTTQLAPLIDGHPLAFTVFDPLQAHPVPERALVHPDRAGDIGVNAYMGAWHHQICLNKRTTHSQGVSQGGVLDHPA